MPELRFDYFHNSSIRVNSLHHKINTNNKKRFIIMELELIDWVNHYGRTDRKF